MEGVLAGIAIFVIALPLGIGGAFFIHFAARLIMRILDICLPE